MKIAVLVTYNEHGPATSVHTSEAAAFDEIHRSIPHWSPKEWGTPPSDPEARREWYYENCSKHGLDEWYHIEEWHLVTQLHRGAKYTERS